MNPTFISIFVFLSAALAVLGLASLVFDLFLRSRATIKERLNDEFKIAPSENSQKSALFRDLKQLASAADRPKSSLWKRFGNLVEQSGLGISASRLLMLAVTCGWCAGIVAAILGKQPWMGIAAFALGLGLPVFWVMARRKRRIDTLRAQLPDAFELMSRALRAGQTVTSSFQIVADNFDDLIGREFSYCHEQQNLGLPLQVALGDLARRTGVMELQMFAVTLSVQRQSGGNPVEMLNNLADVIRKRIRLHGRIQALTGEGRMQALVLLVLPPLMFVALYFLHRSYAEILLEHPQVLSGILAAEVCGALWIRNIINFEY